MAALTFAPAIDIQMAHPAAIALDAVYGVRPLLRGRFHQIGAFVSFPAGVFLVTGYASSSARPAATVYAVTCFLMFVTSACYHRLAQSVMARFWMRRLDHSMIFVHIAGATTPIAVLGVGGSAGIGLLVLSWIGAVIGVGLKLTQLTINRDPCPWLFPVLGWLPLLAVPSLVGSSGLTGVVLLIAAAFIYACGGLCFAKKHPNPSPRVFGYHEIFHVCTLAAGACQFILTMQLVSA